MSNVIYSTYQGASRYMVATLIRGGYLPFERRHDVDAVRAALAKLKAASPNQQSHPVVGKPAVSGLRILDSFLEVPWRGKHR